MKSALKIIAFSNGDPLIGISALLEVALEALDEQGQNLAAAYVDLGLARYLEVVAERSFHDLDGLTSFQ